MTEKIGVWIVGNNAGREVAQPLEELRTTETEQRLEELLVASPEVLFPGLTLIGRQVLTSGGPLDLLGIDQEGRLVLFELKRGTLTRDAVAQIIDYASDLRERDPEDFAALVQESSGKQGIEAIPDFSDWFRREFPDVSEPPPTDVRLVLVGLGVDDRARRMVNFLAESGIDIQLLTFQAFRQGAQVLLARHVETVEPTTRRTAPSGGSKQANRRILEQLAETNGVKELLLEISDFIEPLVPGYLWPGKTALTFSLQELTEQGTPTLRAYVSVWVDQKVHGRVLVSLPDRAIEAAPAAVESILRSVTEASRTTNSWMPFQLAITRDSWPVVKEPLRVLLSAVVNAWRANLAKQG